MATRRRPASPRSRRSSRSGGPGLPRLSPEVTRSIVAVVFLVLGVVILVGLLLPGRGALTDWIVNVIAPWFGSGRWLLPVFLIGLGAYLEWGRGPRAGWVRSVIGATIAYGAFLGIVSLAEAAGILEGRSGGRIGNAIAGPLFGVYLAVYAAGIWGMRRWALPMGIAYAVYVIANLLSFWAWGPVEGGSGARLFGLLYMAVAIGVSAGTAWLLAQRRDDLA